MTPDEVRTRSLYLFLACSQAAQQFADQLAATLPTSVATTRRSLEKAFRRELGILIRFWASRQIWQRLEASEADAKELNIALLRLFTETFGLPKDGSGLRYASLTSATEESRELGQRLTSVLGMEHQPLLAELKRSVSLWNEVVTKYTVEALTLPVDHLVTSVKAWAERSPEPQT